MTKGSEMSPAQSRVLAVVDKHGASMLGPSTWPGKNMVSASAARALVRAGELEEFGGPDGAFVRRTSEGMSER